MTAYVEWVLGSSRGATAPYIVTEVDPQSGAMFARSAWNGEFGGRVAFADLAGKQSSCTGDRTEFLGRNGAPERPGGLESGSRFPERWARGSIRARRCKRSRIAPRRAALKSSSSWVKRKTGNRRANCSAAIAPQIWTRSCAKSQRRWDDILGAVQITTPDRAMDMLLNRWLLYQTLSCRVWARAAFYQLSGAYGFRDQLQDVMALTVAERERCPRTSPACRRAPVRRR